MQKFGGAVRPSSTSPLQSSSIPLHDSFTGGFVGHTYSQPFAVLRSKFRYPALQVSTWQVPDEQVTEAAFGSAAQSRPHAPQFLTSVAREKPSSTTPSQSSSTPLQ